MYVHACAPLTLRYKNPSGFYTQIPKGFVLRYVGAGRQPSADDRALRRKRRYVTQTLRVCVPDPEGGPVT